MKVKILRELKSKMSGEQKHRLLKALRTLKEEYTGNVGGETDIAYADNLQVNEDEFTAQVKPERNAIAKTFDTKSDFDSYVNQRRGIEMTTKEQQAVSTYTKAKPTQMDKFSVKYETTDDFGSNATTVVKKLKEGTQFCWTAFSKHETAEEEGQPEGGGNEEPALQEQDPGEEITVDDTIRITKSTTFVDDTSGANILSDFLQKLSL